MIVLAERGGFLPLIENVGCLEEYKHLKYHKYRGLRYAF